MKNQDVDRHLGRYRYEILLLALLILLFDKIFCPDNTIYLRYVWPVNMVVVSIACYGVFIERSGYIVWVRNILSLTSILIPIIFVTGIANKWFLPLISVFFIVYYCFIFAEVMYQITMTKEVRLNVILGSFCGYLLLSLIALFSYILIEVFFPQSFHNISHNNIANAYNELSYFSFITLTSIGFGDIYPLNDSSRLTVAFFGMVGQFYMVAVVGIVISKFTATRT